MTSSVKLFPGDNRLSLADMPDNSVHSVVCDPPYHLESIQKRFGKEGSVAAKFGTDGAFQRASKGFCGSKWDGADENGVKIAFDVNFWSEVMRVLKPGGYLLAFSAARTYHRMAVAIEDAGFIIHPLKGWVTGSGMPKAHNAAMAIDKSLGAKGGCGDPKSAAHAGWIERGRMRGGEDAENPEAWQRPWMGDADKVDEAARRYIPATEEAQPWDGWAFGSPMKPALEPICFAQKPIDRKTFAKNLLVHGVGAVNIDACRVPPTGESQSRDGEGAIDNLYADQGVTTFTGKPGAFRGGNPAGRHPANLLHDGSEDVVALFPTNSGQRAPLTGHTKERQSPNGTFGKFAPAHDAIPKDEPGSAARFFNSFPLDSDPIMYQAKATKADRAGSTHPTVKPIALMQWLVRLVTPVGGIVLDPFAGSGTTGEAARREGFDCILMEAEPEYIDFLRSRFDLDMPFDGEADFMEMLG